VPDGCSTEDFDKLWNLDNIDIISTGRNKEQGKLYLNVYSYQKGKAKRNGEISHSKYHLKLAGFITVAGSSQK
jgi:hypothetical protein